jgi:DNA-binding FrmR family transcriptional regulator
MAKMAGMPERRRRELAARLSRIEGQVRGLRKMAEEDRYCVDLLMQIASVQEALRGVGKQVMRHYLQTCATKAIQGRNRDGIYDELMDVIYKYTR